MGNSMRDAHRRRVKEHEENQRIFTDAASNYLREKGPESVEAIRRAAKGGGYRPRVRVGGYEQDV